jgi:hypothetical protein
MTGRRILTLAAAGAAMLLLGCGQSGRTGLAGPHDPPAPSDVYELRADGTVPWVDERITDEDLAPRPAVPGPGSGPCRAGQLTGVLDRWWSPKPGAGGGADMAPRLPDLPKLIGYVDIRNTSTKECTVQGEVDVRLYSQGREVPIGYSHAVNDEARRRVYPVRPGVHVRVRLDWTAPFCADAPPPYELLLRLPDGGGELRAPVVASDRPPCPRGEINPNLRSFLSSDGFSPAPDPAADAESPLTPLTVAVTGPESARAGGSVVYHVALSNLTDHPVPLDPCPGYVQQLTAPGYAGTALYRLNCRPVHEIAAGHTVRYEMVFTVPEKLPAGARLAVSWSIRAPQRPGPGAHLYGEFTLTVV